MPEWHVSGLPERQAGQEGWALGERQQALLAALAALAPGVAGGAVVSETG